MNQHARATEDVIRRHGVPATYTRLGNPVITFGIKIANVNFQERPADHPDLLVQMSMRWVVLAADLKAGGIARPYEGDRIVLLDTALVLTVNRYGLRVANGEVVAFDLEATGR